MKAIFGLLPATEQKKDPEPAVRPLANRSSAKTPVVGDEADAEAKARAEKSAAVSLANRATEISRTQGIAYNRAFKQAQREAAAKA